MAYTRLNVLVTARERRRGVRDSSSFRVSWCRTGDGIHGVIYHTPPPAPQKEGQLNATSAPVRRHRQMSTNSTPTPVGRHFSKENICNPNFALTLTHMEPNDAWAAVRWQREARRRTSEGCGSCTHTDNKARAVTRHKWASTNSQRTSAFSGLAAWDEPHWRGQKKKDRCVLRQT